MESPERASPNSAPEENESRGPRDDFYCWKFEIWYPSEDCIFRHTRKTYPACAGCFQGRLNARHAQRGLKAPVIVPALSAPRS